MSEPTPAERALLLILKRGGLDPIAREIGRCALDGRPFNEHLFLAECPACHQPRELPVYPTWWSEQLPECDDCYSKPRTRCGR